LAIPDSTISGGSSIVSAPYTNIGHSADQRATKLVSRTEAALPASPQLFNFTSKSVIDWLEIKIVTRKRTNFSTVQKHVMRILGTKKKCWVKALNERPGRAATIFVISLQDPKSFADMQDLFMQLDARFPFKSLPHVVAMEVAVDFYSCAHKRAELEGMTVMLKRQISVTGANPRQCEPLRRAGPLRTRSLRAGYEEVRAGGTLYIGMRNDPVKWRIYLKDIDNNKKPIADVKLHRARMEVTLRGDGLTPYVTTLASLGQVKFEQLATKFRCRVFMPPKPAASSSMAARVADVVKRRSLNLSARAGQHDLEVATRRKFSQHSRADVPLNTLVRGSLRSLTERFNAKKRGALRPRTRISSRATGSPP
jgi:hypothetical protein